MRITEVRVFPVDEDKLKAFASIVIDDAFVVSDIKIIEGRNGRFLSMPSTKRKNGTFRDIAHPLNQQTRQLIEERIFERYDEILTSDDRALVDEVIREERAAVSGGSGRLAAAPPPAPGPRGVPLDN
jgi:stage V sporulation protein G